MNDTTRCMKCGRPLTQDEIGLHKKLINRGSTEFMCITCLAAFYRCTEELLRSKIVQFREQGCLLFTRSAQS